MTRRAAAILFSLALALTAARSAAAEPLDDNEVEERLRFLESRLSAEATQARWYEGCWALVHVGGMGYGTFEIAQSSTHGALADGIVTTVKSIVGAVTLGVRPLKTGRANLELSADVSPSHEQRLALAESLLMRNAAEVDFHYAWQPHLISLAMNLVGGAVVWLAGDVRRAAQSTGLAIAAGELAIWTRPWGARRDLRRYRRQFGDLAFAHAHPSPPTPTLRLALSGVGVTF